MAKRIALRLAPLVGDRFVASGETYRLERQEADLLGIVERELNDFSDLLVVNAVHDRDDWHDFAAGGVEIVDGLELYIEQVADRAMRVSSIADTVELQIGIAQPGFNRLLRELDALSELDAVGRSLYGV